MKQLKFILSALAVASFASCETPEETKQPQGSVDIDLTASVEEVSGLTFSWAANDKVTIYDGKGKNVFTTTEGGSTATFSGEADSASEVFYGIYPYTTESLYSGYINLTVSDAQEGVKGGIDKDNLILAAYLSLTDSKVLDFKHALSFAKITLSEADAVVSVELKSNGDELIAGPVRVGVFAEPTVETRPNAVSSVTLTGNPLVGTYYIAVVPQTLASGYTVTFVNLEDKRCSVSTSGSVTFARAGVIDLGTYNGIEWAEPINPEPTAVPSVKVVKSSFKEAEFNVVSDGDFEYFAGKRNHLDQRSNWRVLLEATTIEGQNGGSGVNLFNSIAGHWMDPAVQSLPLIPHTDYVYTAWAKSNTEHVYNGVNRMPVGGFDNATGWGFSEIGGPIGTKERGEGGTHGWAPNNEWTLQSIEFYTGDAFYADVFCRIAGDVAGAPPLINDGLDANFSYDNVRLIPKGYEHMSMEFDSFEVLGSVKNATYDGIESLGKVTAWRNIDGKIAMCLSNFKVNGQQYDNGIVLTDNEDLTTSELCISKFLKDGGKIRPFIVAGEGEISIVPNDAFVVDGKVYMHYYAKTSQDAGNPEVWTVGYAGFAVSEDGGRTWTKCDGTWKGDGCFVQAGFYEKDGVLYMAASRAGRETTTYWANMYVAKCDMSLDFTDPANWEYWNAFEWIKGNEDASNVSICCLTVGPRSEPQLVYNEKFGRWMMLFRSGNIRGLVFRDAEEIQGPWSGEKILTDDDITGQSYCPSVIDQTQDGDLLMVVPQL